MFVHNNVRKREIDQKKEFALLEKVHGTGVLLVLKNVVIPPSSVVVPLKFFFVLFFCLKTRFYNLGQICIMTEKSVCFQVQMLYLEDNLLSKYTGNTFVRYFSRGGTVACLETALLMCKILLLFYYCFNVVNYFVITIGLRIVLSDVHVCLTC